MSKVMPGSSIGNVDVVHMRCLVHQVFAGQLVAARSEQMYDGGGAVIGDDVGPVVGVGRRAVFLQEGEAFGSSGSFFQVGSAGSFRKAAVTRQIDLSSPASGKVSGIEAAVKLPMCDGFQPIL